MSELFKVTLIKSTMTILPDGKPTDAYIVSFETKSGVAGEVTIPVSSFKRDEVELQINRIAREIEETLQL